MLTRDLNRPLCIKGAPFCQGSLLCSMPMDTTTILVMTFLTNNLGYIDNTYNQGILNGKHQCTIDLLFDWFGISCMTTDNFCFSLPNRLIQTSQTEG